MLKKPGLQLVLFLAVCLSSGPVFAQNYVEFLGPGQSDQITYSPKYGIPYRDNGFSHPSKRGVKKGIKRAKKRRAPTEILDEIRRFPGDSRDAIGQWIDQAFDEARAAFAKCGGPLADFAAAVSPSSLWGGVTIESTIWYEPALNSVLAGGYYPGSASIRVVNLYYGTTGDYRHARLLLKWEMKNHFGTLAGISSEPYVTDWPCRAR